MKLKNGSVIKLGRNCGKTLMSDFYMDLASGVSHTTYLKVFRGLEANFIVDDEIRFLTEQESKQHKLPCFEEDE